MASILAQIGTAVGQEIKALSQGNTADEYKKLVYNSDGTLASVELYSDSSLTELVNNKVFTYLQNRLHEVKFYVASQLVYTQSFSYDAEGVLTNIGKDYA